MSQGIVLQIFIPTNKVLCLVQVVQQGRREKYQGGRAGYITTEHGELQLQVELFVVCRASMDMVWAALLHSASTQHQTGPGAHGVPHNEFGCLCHNTWRRPSSLLLDLELVPSVCHIVGTRGTTAPATVCARYVSVGWLESNNNSTLNTQSYAQDCRPACASGADTHKPQCGGTRACARMHCLQREWSCNVPRAWQGSVPQAG